MATYNVYESTYGTSTSGTGTDWGSGTATGTTYASISGGTYQTVNWETETERVVLDNERNMVFRMLPQKKHSWMGSIFPKKGLNKADVRKIFIGRKFIIKATRGHPPSSDHMLSNYLFE